MVRVLLLGAVLVGCVQGRDFTRSPADTLTLGKTTRQEIVTRMGSPVEQGTVSRTGVVLQSIQYHQWSSTGYERGQMFFLRDDILVGHSYSSTETNDSTNFDATRVNLIRKGETTEREVITLLGPPSGAFIYPFIKGRDDHALGWYYAPPYRRSDPGARVLKIVIISFDPNGAVTDLDVRVQGPQ
jgi:outer membrane protein assembly factor BamE (lipoprotein component of BamABCDE complex)